MATATEKDVLKAEAKKTFDDLSPEVKKTVEAARGYVTISNEGTPAVDPATYERLLELNNSSKEAYIGVQEANAVIYPALAYVFGEKGIPVMAENADVKQITGVVPCFGKDTISVGLKRSSPYTLRDSEGTVTGTGTSFGTISVDHKIYATKTRGELAKVKNLIGELGAASLSS
jgi:hypothetical protein